MNSHRTRRFTEKEVAAVLRTASEIDKSGGAGGLSEQDLQEIASEVGISPEAISQAVARLEAKRGQVPLLAVAPAVYKSVHAVDGELGEEALGQLIHVVDEETHSTGAIAEVLGSVRWRNWNRFQSMQVLLTPRNGETVVQVVGKLQPRLQRMMYALPFVLAAGAATVADANAGGLAMVVAAGASALVAGGAISRFVWNGLAVRTGKRVRQLAASLSEQAEGASRTGLVVSEDEPDRHG